MQKITSVIIKLFYYSLYAKDMEMKSTSRGKSCCPNVHWCDISILMIFHDEFNEYFTTHSSLIINTCLCLVTKENEYLNSIVLTVVQNISCFCTILMVDDWPIWLPFRVINSSPNETVLTLILRILLLDFHSTMSWVG